MRSSCGSEETPPFTADEDVTESVQVAPMLAIITVLVLLAAIGNALCYLLEQHLSARGHDTAEMSF